MSEKSKRFEEPILSREQVRACDGVAIEQYEINGLVLMENAGGAAARYIQRVLRAHDGNRAAIIAGAGNNAGDGFVVARHLVNEGIEVVVVICVDRERFRGDALSNLVILEHMQVPIKYLAPEAVGEAIQKVGGESDLLVDALLGTGTSGPPREPFRTAIETINQLDVPVVALDIPSGLDCDSGAPLGIAVKADHTVTFAAIKQGYSNPEAKQYTGEVILASIGIDVRYLRTD
jgi:NAD(P)H-hydrate epimerase